MFARSLPADQRSLLSIIHCLMHCALPAGNIRVILVDVVIAQQDSFLNWPLAEE